jgi:hypothetical protein
MDLTSDYIPDNILRLMPKEERERLGKAGITRDEAVQSAEAKNERDLQDQIQAFLQIREIIVGRQRMDKKSNMIEGWPDIVFCYRGIPWAWEVKLPGKEPEPHQQACLEKMRANGWRVAVVSSVSHARELIGAYS